MTLVQTEPKKICMWGEPPAPIIEYDQGEGTIVVQRRDIFTGTITESGTYTFQASLKSTSNWTSHLILYVNGNETVHFMKAGADGFLGFSKDVDLSSGDSVRIYGYHDLSGEVAYVAGTKLFKAELEPISSSISGTVSTGSPLYAVYNLSNPTPGVYRWNVGSRSNSNGINLYKSINGGAGELIASMTDGSYVDVQVSEGTTSLSLFYSMGSGSNTNISGGSVTVYPDSSSLVEKEIKRVTIRPNGVEKQIRPSGGGGWQPGANTIAYYPLTSQTTVNDMKGSGTAYNLSNNGGVTFGTNAGVSCANFPGNNNYRLGTSISTLPQSNSVRTFSFWFYDTSGSRFNENLWFWCGTGSSNHMVSSGQSNGTYGRWVSQYGQLGYSNSGDEYNKWIYCTITYNGSKFSVYKNNNLLFEWTYSINTSGQTFRIGGGATWSGTHYFKGYISEFIIENKVRTDQERSDYYNQIKGNYGL